MYRHHRVFTTRLDISASPFCDSGPIITGKIARDARENNLPVNWNGKFSHILSIGKGFQSLDRMVELPVRVADFWGRAMGDFRSAASGI